MEENVALDPPPRTASQVIDQAVAENRFGERLLYFLAATFGIVGIVIIIYSMWTKQPIVAVAGGISEVLCWPAIASARQTRRESLAIRLLEAPLSRADTSEDAARMIHQFFGQLMLKDSQVKKGRRGGR